MALAWAVAAMLACSAHAVARPSAFLGRARALAPPARAVALPRALSRLSSVGASAAAGVDDEFGDEGVDFETEVLKNARVTEDWNGEGAWVLVTREFDEDEGDDDDDDADEAGGGVDDLISDVSVTARLGRDSVELEVDTDESEVDDEEEGVVLVQDPADDKFLLTLFQSEEDATRYLYMLLDEDIDSEATYAAAWYTSEDIAELLDEDIKLALI
ncbi:hypothetical protein KFE25_003713 [Diacronema lutheri]|uniref:Uncharacterized protein n=2 Tax=Diacronema lutheri TaxID=2081491 RepID=A0A8J5X4H6_DIALT|nr:hypothetical protein KFE25_003713 [Diacronema lutheri]